MKNILCFFLFGIISFSVSSQILFQEVATSKGINASFGAGFVGGGISFYDFDNDGWDDITLGTEEGEPVLFFKNVNGSFTQVYPNIIDDLGQNKQVIWIDYDNDGDKDLYVAGYIAPNKLYQNDGNFDFTNVTVESGLSFLELNNFGATWGDYNNDGYLDVFLTFRSLVESNRLYLNNGDGTFTDQSIFAGISQEGHLSFCASFFDYDKDGWQDIYIANDRNWTTNIMYHNNGNGTFTDVSELTNTNLRMDAMSTAIGDYNNDGWLDIYVTNTNDYYEEGEIGNALLKNNGDGTFTNVAAATGTDFSSIAWGAVFLDADNDQDVDLYVSGMLDGSVSLPSAFYENNGTNSYSIPYNVGFTDDIEESYSNAIGDLNNDGYPEIVVLNEYANVFLWENLCNDSNNWLKVKLEGVLSNRDGLGSWIEVETFNGTQYRYTTSGEGYLGQNSSYEFFGLGNNTIINSLKVKWLSGAIDVIYDIPSNQSLTILEGSNPLSINEHVSQGNVSIFPNPVKDVVSISSNIGIQKVKVRDMLGREVLSKNFQTKYELTLNINVLLSGNYIMEIYSNGTKEIIKIIKY